MKRLFAILFIFVVVGHSDAGITIVHTLGQTAGATFSYIFEDCFDGTDGNDLATYGNGWTLAAGTSGGAYIETDASADGGGCADASDGMMMDNVSATQKVYRKSFDPGSIVYTFAIQYDHATQVQDNTEVRLFYLSDTDTVAQFGLGRYVDLSDPDDLRLYYDSDNDGSPDTLIVVCTQCLPLNTEIELSLTVDTANGKVTNIHVNGTDYTNAGSGWNVGHNAIKYVTLSCYSNPSNQDTYFDSMRAYAGVRQAGK